MKKIFVGIDPDIKKNGVAFWYKDAKRLELENLTFFELFDVIKNLKTRNQISVIIDAGWMNQKTNFRQKYFDKKSKKWVDYRTGVKEKMSSDTGANHETGRKIAEMCDYLGVPYEFHRPTETKLNKEAFAKITGYAGRTNQDKRDAGMLVFGL